MVASESPSSLRTPSAMRTAPYKLIDVNPSSVTGSDFRSIKAGSYEGLNHVLNIMFFCFGHKSSIVSNLWKSVESVEEYSVDKEEFALKLDRRLTLYDCKKFDIFK